MMLFRISVSFFFWLVCDVIIFIGVFNLWKILSESPRQTKRIIFTGIILVAVVYLITFHAGIVQRFLFPSYNKLNRYIHYQLTVDTYCNLWVLIESFIAATVICIYHGIVMAFTPLTDDARLKAFKKYNKRLQLVIIGLVFVFAIFFFSYHVVYIRISQKGLLSLKYIYKSFHFFYYLCGFLWVSIDAIVAVYVIKLWLLIRKHKGAIINALR